PSSGVPGGTGMKRFRMVVGAVLLSPGFFADALAQACPTDTTQGALVVEISPGPSGEPVTVALTGPGGFNASVQATTTYRDRRAGPYRAQLTRGERVVADALPIR